MSTYSSLKIFGFDHVELAVESLEPYLTLHLDLGFQKLSTRTNIERDLQSELLIQNGMKVVLTHSKNDNDPVSQHVKKHGSGVFAVGYLCEDVYSVVEQCASRGATVIESPKSTQRDSSSVVHATILIAGDIRHVLISRQGNLFAEGFEPTNATPFPGTGLMGIDHVTTNIETAQISDWTTQYEKILGLINTKTFDIHTRRSGLYSIVMESPDHTLKMPFNEPTDPKSQIQEFLDINHGPGIQHLAMHTNDIIRTVRQLRQNGIEFLETPASYYESIPSRVPNVEENLQELAELGILVDGDQNGYILQIFTKNLIGPFFYEVIQRKGHLGFGEGNFQALFEAIERDQLKRGVLT